MRNSGRFSVIHGVLLSFALSLVQAPAALAQNKHTLPLFVSASHQTLQGFARIINLSERAGEVTIHAIDDAGQRFDPVTLSLAAKATRHFSSDDLRDGNTEKGLSGGIGSGQGNWRLELETDLDIDPLVYTRPRGEGFVTSTHDVVAEGESMRWRVSFFNPGSNTAQQSWLRVVNTSGIDTAVRIEGLDDKGAAGTGVVRFDLAANAARMLSAKELEEGSADSTFDGQIGDGAGKWQLFVSADQPIQVMSLLLSETGYLTNLSTSTIGDRAGSAGFAPANQAAFDALFVGKVIIGTGSLAGTAYHRYLGGNRFTDTRPEDGGVETGSYKYRGTGPNTGILELTYDHDVECTVQFNMTFTSATAGTFSGSCGGVQLGDGSWKSVPSPRIDDFAPVDQASFDALFVGRTMDGGDGDTTRFLGSNRFTYIDTEDGDTEGGSYTYQRATSNTGNLEIHWDNGFQCSFSMMFSSATGGTFTTTCDSSGYSSGSWRLVETVEAPAVGFAPANQAAFDTRFVGKRWLLPNEGYVDFVSPGRLVFEDQFGEPDTKPGSYTYQRTGKNVGTLNYQFDEDRVEGKRCTAQLTFVTAIFGNTTFSCTDGEGGGGSWRTVDIPGT